MHGADLLAACLRSEGIETVFGVPGEEAMALVHALEKAGVTFLPTHDQSAAAIAAAAEGSIHRRTGACLVSRGPGATRLVTGLASATHDGYPVIALVAGPHQEREHLPHQQHLNLERLLHPVTKATIKLSHPAAIPDAVREASRVAFAEKPGAVAIIIPENVATGPAPADAQPLAPHAPRIPQPDAEALREAARRLDGAENPVILAGHGVVRAGAHDDLQALADRASIPVITTYMGKAAIPWAHQMYAGSLGREAPDHADALLRKADVVLAAGYSSSEFAPAMWHRDGAQIIHLGLQPAHVEAAYNPSLEVIGCIRQGLTGLAELCRSQRRPESQAAGLAGEVRAALAREMEAAQREGTSPLNPQRVVMALSRALREPDVLCVDVGAHQEWTCRLYPLKRAGTFWTSHSFAAMGFALPAAIGVALGLEGGHRCVAVMGDGGWLASAAEVETAVRSNLPLTVVVLCDHCYGQQAAEAQARYGSAAGTRFSPVDVAAQARALGAGAHTAESPDDLERAMLQAARTREVVVIAVPVSTRYNESLVEGVPAAVSRTSP